MTPYELVTFFTEQLEREGWLGVDAVDLGSAAFQTFNFVDEAGAGWFGLLLVSAGDRVTDQRRASFSVERIHG